MDPTPLSSLVAARITFRTPDKNKEAGAWARGALLIVSLDDPTTVLGEVDPTRGLYDANGNFFYRNV
jgi:hypothetical protein